MITSYKIVIDPNDFEKVLILVGGDEEELRWFIGRHPDAKISNVKMRKWYGFQAYHVAVKGPDAVLSALVSQYPPMKFAKDEAWAYQRDV